MKNRFLLRDDHSSRSHDHSSRSHDHSSRSNDHSSRSHDHSSRSHDHIFRSHDHSSRSHDHSSRSHDHSSRSNDHSSRSNDHSSRTHDHSSRSHDHSSRSHDHSSRSHDHSSRSHSSRSHDHSSRSHDHSSRSHDHSSRSHDHSSRSNDHSSRSHDHSSGSHDHDHRSRSHDQFSVPRPQRLVILSVPCCHGNQRIRVYGLSEVDSKWCQCGRSMLPKWILGRSRALESCRGGANSQFGLDFKKHGMTWTREFCQMDSDGDGKTNGQELGDPSCTWSKGETPASKNATHPGVCEPLDSEHCNVKNAWLKCNPKFECPAMEAPGVFPLNVTLPKTRVPPQHTYHECMVFEFPQDGDYHVIANTPILDNKVVMHHVVVFGCADDEHKGEVGETYECQFLNFDAHCTDMLALWALGMQGECMHENAGFRVGSNGYKRAVLQIHWENHRYADDLFDASGMTFYLTPNLRANDMGVLFVGQEHFVIPPGATNHTEVGHCYPECSRRKWTSDLYATGAINHMHYIGKSEKVEQIRNGNVIKMITDEPNFIFDNPVPWTYKDPVVLKPGDELRITCSYDATMRNFTTRAGDGYNREMCFTFIRYYPKQAIKGPKNYCTSWLTIPDCQFELDEEIRGCDFKNIHNMNHPPSKALFDKVLDRCRPFGPCYEDCRPIVEDIRKNPCYQGDLWVWQRENIGEPFDNKPQTADWYRFYAALDSCMSEIEKEETEISGGSHLVLHPLLSAILFAIVLVFL